MTSAESYNAQQQPTLPRDTIHSCQFNKITRSK